MNHVTLLGRLTADPQITYTNGANGELAIARFNLAVDRRVKKDAEQTADFISCVSFGKTAEFIEKYIFKGSKIAVEGHIQTGSYTNKDGNKVYTTDVVVEQLEFAGAKVEGATPKKEEPAGDGFMNYDPVDDEDLPFN